MYNGVDRVPSRASATLQLASFDANSLIEAVSRPFFGARLNYPDGGASGANVAAESLLCSGVVAILG